MSILTGQRQQKALRWLRNQATKEAASKYEQILLWKRIYFPYHVKVGTGKEDYLVSLHLLLYFSHKKKVVLRIQRALAPSR